jgi:hypothetical protein
MIFLQTKDGHNVFVLEPNNLQHLAKGGVTFSPDNSIAVMYTPDAIWMASQLESAAADPAGLSVDIIDRVHRESMRRAPVVMSPDAEGGQIIHNGKPVAKA